MIIIHLFYIIICYICLRVKEITFVQLLFSSSFPTILKKAMAVIFTYASPIRNQVNMVIRETEALPNL